MPTHATNYFDQSIGFVSKANNFVQTGFWRIFRTQCYVKNFSNENYYEHPESFFALRWKEKEEVCFDVIS